MPSLVGNPEAWFSRFTAHIYAKNIEMMTNTLTSTLPSYPIVLTFPKSIFLHKHAYVKVLRVLVKYTGICLQNLSWWGV